MRTVYCVAIEDDSSGAVDWYPGRSEAEAEYVAALSDFPDDEINLFALEVDTEVPGASDERDAITDQVDAAMWDREYEPLRWRKGKNHSAAPHSKPPTD
jgi:hypothetical protein